MKSVNKKQIVVIIGTLIVIVLFLFANTGHPDKKEEVKIADHLGHDDAGVLKMVESAKSTLNEDQKKLVKQLEEAITGSSNKKVAFEMLVNHWDSLSKPAVAAYYTEQAAIALPVEKNWLEAGNRYYAATRFVKEDERHILFEKAMESFEKTLEKNPKNVEAKINLAACYVEGSPDPMKGIGMLKEVEKTDSNNINLQLNFAFFSEKSGQWDKAITRFEKVLKIQPEFIEAYLHLADAYQQKGDTAKVIESLEKYIKLVDDVTIKTEVKEYINKLKKS